MGCSSDATPERQRVVVFAASSLTDVLGVLESRFERAHPDIDIALSFAGSQVLRMQIQQGAPAELFISANPEHMADLVAQGQVKDTRIFAYNRLALVLPKANPAGILRAEELPKAQRLVMGNEDVPIGDYTRQWLRNMDVSTGTSFSTKVLSKVVSQENNVRLLRAKVELGEADAAVVYLTDALSSQEVRRLAIDSKTNIRTVYQLGNVSNRRDNPALDTWRDFLKSDEARQLMKQEGLDLP